MSGRPPPITIPPITIPGRQNSTNSTNLTNLNLQRMYGIRVVNSGRRSQSCIELPPNIRPDYSSCQYIKTLPGGTEEYGRMRNGRFEKEVIVSGGVKKRKTMKRKLKKRKTSKRKHYRV